MLTALHRKRAKLQSALGAVEAEIGRLESVPRTYRATFSRCVDKHVLVRAKSRAEAEALAEKKAKRAEPRWRGARHEGGRWQLTYMAPVERKT